MVVFKMEEDEVDGETIWYLAWTSVNKEDKVHSNQIYEQLDAELVFNL